MVSSFLTQYVVDKMMEEEHPTVNASRCMNARQRKVKCTQCKHICPQSVYTRPGEVGEWQKCINCNQCVTACPSRALASSVKTLEQYERILEKETSSVWIGCEKSEGAYTLKVQCLAALPWEYLAYMLLQSKVMLAIGKCQTCEQSQCIDILKSQLHLVSETIGSEIIEKRLVFTTEENGAQAPMYSRREMMHLFFRSSKRSVAKLVPDFLQEEVGSEGLLYRVMLHEQMKRQKGDFKWTIPHYTDKCWGCTTCIKVCPQQALEMVDQDEMRYVKLHLWKCNQCGLCEQVCYDEGIKGRAEVMVPDLTPVTIAKLKLRRCEVCGRPIRHGKPHRCAACR
ncbi:MAG: 4Fe-4S dicluster domain-containing protein [Cellulosilyticaceae bacterium]